MVKILEYGNPYQIRCEYCNTLFEFNENDVTKSPTHSPANDFYYTINCPVCHSSVGTYFLDEWYKGKAQEK